jgi:predicted nucleotidyltransferase
MQSDEVKEEIIKYVQALETSYTDAIRDLKSIIDREKKVSKKVVAERINMSTERNELESLFIECIEEVRKEIMKRRLKNEIYNRKKFQQLDKSSEEAKEFEESLLRLAQLAKNRVKVGDFTSKDKAHILDLFVNNERTLLKIYEALFPHRAAPAAQSSMQPQQPMSMMENSFNNSLQMMGRSDQRSAGGVRQG